MRPLGSSRCAVVRLSALLVLLCCHSHAAPRMEVAQRVASQYAHGGEYYADMRGKKVAGSQQMEQQITGFRPAPMSQPNDPAAFYSQDDLDKIAAFQKQGKKRTASDADSLAVNAPDDSREKKRQKRVPHVTVTAYTQANDNEKYEADGYLNLRNPVYNGLRGGGAFVERSLSGLVDCVRHPEECVEGAGEVVVHPIKTVKAVEKQIQITTARQGLAYTLGGAAAAGAMVVAPTEGAAALPAGLVTKPIATVGAIVGESTSMDVVVTSSEVAENVITPTATAADSGKTAKDADHQKLPMGNGNLDGPRFGSSVIDLRLSDASEESD